MFWTAFASAGRRTYYDYPCEFHPPKDRPPVSDTIDDAHTLSDKEVASFYERGFLGPFDLVTSDESPAILEHLLTLINTTESPCLSYKRGDFEFEDDAPQDEASRQFILQRMNAFNRHLDDEVLLGLFKSKAVTDRCAQLLGPDLLLWQSVFFNVKAKQPGTRWHQASTFIMTDSVEPFVFPPDTEQLFQLTCWIALTDATIDNGCLKMIPGSHRQIWPVSMKKISQGVENSTYGSYEANIEYPIESAEVQHIEVKAGQFILFTERVVHGSVDNTTDIGRWAVNGRIVATHTRVLSRDGRPGVRHFPMYGIRNMKMDHWKAILIRGMDRHGLNRLAQ